MNRPENAKNADQLHGAFVVLLPPGSLQLTRSDKRAFRERFETFLNSINGLLYI
jgi:hypothetical protein